MKLFIFAFCVAAALASKDGHCKNREDCKDGECCVNISLVPWFGGRCRSLATEGQDCTPLLKNDVIPDMYHFRCPCVSGLTCRGENEFDIFDHKLKHKAKCVDEGTQETTVEPVITDMPEFSEIPEIEQ